jgi:hypothetical protein
LDLRGVATQGIRLRWGAMSVAAIGALALTNAAPAGSATTVGQTGPALDCGMTTVMAQLSTAGPPSYSIPSDGVITSFTAFGFAGEQVKLLILERVSSSPPVFRIVEKSAFGTFGATGLQTFPTQIPGRAGQEIGLYGLVCGFASPGDVVAILSFASEPALGAEVTFGATQNTIRMDASAELEPDCDADGFGDETQDPQIPFSEACGKGNRTLTLDANKNKVKKGKRVTLTGEVNQIVRQGVCESGQTVELQRKRPSQTTFTTIEQLQTDAAGSFFAKKKVKKTFEYRAQVLETATCGGQISNTEKVKVKKPK